MRGLLPRERDMLKRLDGPGVSAPAGEWERATAEQLETVHSLVFAGRVKLVPAHPRQQARITPAGREALAIDAALRAMGVAI